MPRHRTTIRLLLAGVMTGWPIGSTGASAQSTISNYVDFAVTATDNYNLDPPGAEDSALVTTVTGGTTVRHRGPRVDAALDAALSLDTIASDGLELRVRPYLLGTGTAELLDDRLFVDASASWRRLLLDTGGRFSANPAGGRGDRSNVQTLSVSPYLLQRFGDWADAELRYRRQETFYGDEGVGDTSTDLARLSVRSGRALPRLLLNGVAEYEDTRGDNQASDLERTTATLGAEYGLTRRIGLLGTIGYEAIDTDQLGDLPDGPIWNAGLRLRPGPRSELRFTYGRRYGDDDFSADFRYRIGARWTARAGYGNFLQTTQRALLRDDVILDPETGALLNAGTGVPVDLADPGLGLVNEIYISRRFDASLIGEYPRDRFLVEAVREERDFQVRDDETVSGIRGSWNHRLTQQTDLLASVSYRTVEREVGIDPGDTVAGLLQVSHRLGPNTVARAAVTRTQRTADRTIDEYTENTVSAGIRIGF